MKEKLMIQLMININLNLNIQQKYVKICHHPINLEFFSFSLLNFLLLPQHMTKLKVIVLSGFLGAGKTTFIKNVLELADDLRISIILNDISEFDMDIELVKNKSIKFKKTNDMIEMGGGCVCCTLKDEMIKEVKKIHKSKKYDYLFIEATGISTPLPVAQAFNATDSIKKIVEIYSMITVIDAEHFLMNLTSDEVIKNEEPVSKGVRRSARIRAMKEHKNQGENNQMEEEQPTLCELMINQLEIANIIIVNKKDLVTPQDLGTVVGYLKSINPNSEIVTTSYSKVNLKDLMKAPKFDLQKAENDQKWILEKQKIQDIPETIKYNISSFVYDARRPFEPNKFYDLINSPKNHQFWSQITRAKGFFWLANYPKFSFTLQKAGARIYYQLDLPWWCQISKKHWGETEQQREEAKHLVSRFWDDKVGDKRNQFVFISQNLKRQQIEAKLNSCLIKECEMENYEIIYGAIEDPFENRWKDGVNMFMEEGLLLENDGEWEEVSEGDEEQEIEDQSEEQKFEPPTRRSIKNKNK